MHMRHNTDRSPAGSTVIGELKTGWTSACFPTCIDAWILVQLLSTTHPMGLSLWLWREHVDTERRNLRLTDVSAGASLCDHSWLRLRSVSAQIFLFSSTITLSLPLCALWHRLSWLTHKLTVPHLSCVNLESSSRPRAVLRPHFSSLRPSPFFSVNKPTRHLEFSGLAWTHAGPLLFCRSQTQLPAKLLGCIPPVVSTALHVSLLLEDGF